MMLPRHLSLVLLAPVLYLAVAAPASAALPATGTSEVVAALRSDPVYVDAQAELRSDVTVADLQAQLSKASAAIYVAVLPAAAGRANGSCTGLLTAIDKQLGRGTVLIGVCGKDFAGVAAPGAGLAAGVTARIMRDRGDAGNVTASFVSAIGDLQAAGSSTAAKGTSGSTTSSGSGGALLLGVLGLGAVGGGGYLFTRSRTRRRQELQGMRADVESLYDRLGRDVSTLSPGEDPATRQALADAAERYSSMGSLMSRAHTPGEWAAARRTAVEGLSAARLVRTNLGLDPGPDVPPPPATGRQLEQSGSFELGGQQIQGSPTYQPGQSYYYGGGRHGNQYVPGGWYSMPFWETALMASVLTGGMGGFGGGFGGGGYERGYDQGYESGRDAGQDAGGQQGGGDWGGGGDSGGGGDWGGGGDSGGGGDW